MTHRLVFIAAFGFGCGLGSLSFGQSANTSADETATSGLEEIVVTAQRRQESLERAAIPVTAMTGDSLAKAGVTDVQALTNMVPAVQIATGSGPYNLFYLRGVGSFNVNPLSDAAVSLNLDGVPISRPSSTSGLFYDLERVEVLKGPQGTLYGRNATGGAINVITRSPQLGATDGEFTADFGNYDSRKFSGALNLPVGETAAVRAAFSTSDHQGYLSDGTDDDKGAAGRLRALVEPTSDLTINLGADYYHQGGRGGGAAIVQGDLPNNRIGNTDPRSQAIYSSTLYFPAGSFLPPLPEFAHADNNYWGVNGSLDWKTPIGNLTVIPAFRHSAINYDSPESGLYVIETTVSKQSSVEARFASSEDQPLRWLVGTYYLDESDRTALDYDSQFNLSHQRLDLPLTSEAAFGRLTYAIVDRFRLTGGVRYTRDRKSIEGDGSSSNILCFAALTTGNPLACAGTPGFPYSNIPPPQVAASIAAGGAPIAYGTTGATVLSTPVNVHESETFTKTTWRAAAEWDVAEHSMFYASVETGFKAGGFFFANLNPTYKPESITAYTLGSKNRFLDNRLQVNGELFLWKYKDQQIALIDQLSDGETTLATENVGRATMKGFEADSLYALTASTLLGADLQYLDARYDQFSYLVPNLGAVPVANCPNSSLGAFYAVSCNGRVAPESPKWTVALNGQQKLPLGPAGSLVLDLSAKYQTASYVGVYYLDSQLQQSYWLGSGQLTYEPVSTAWSVTAYVANIGDTLIKTDAFAHPIAGAALVSTSLYPPRTYGARFNVKF